MNYFYAIQISSPRFEDVLICATDMNQAAVMYSKTDADSHTTVQLRKGVFRMNRFGRVFYEDPGRIIASK